MYAESVYSDAIEQESSLPGWIQEYRQISAGKYHGKTSIIANREVTILRERINVRTEQVFSAPKEKLVFYYYNGNGETKDFVLGGDHSAPAGFAWDWIDRVGFMSSDSDLLMVVLDGRWFNSSANVRSGNLHGAEMHQADDIAHWLISLFTVVADNRRAGRSDRQLEEVVPDLVQDRLSMLYQSSDLCTYPNVANAELAYRRLRDRLHEDPFDFLTVSALSRELRVPAPVLRRVCLEFTGIKLDHLLVQLRLNGARRSLIDARGQQCRVCDIAMNWGFMHLSRFAARYRRLFGERPSETLRPAGSR
jgi:AraC family ethanolamine operon transcriptional activator